MGRATVLIVASSTYASVVKQRPETSRVDVTIPVLVFENIFWALIRVEKF